MPKRIVWAGSSNKVQNVNVIRQITVGSRKNLAIIIIVKAEEGYELSTLSIENVYLFQNLD